jgi:hypothetical protein
MEDYMIDSEKEKWITLKNIQSLEMKEKLKIDRL